MLGIGTPRTAFARDPRQYHDAGLYGTETPLGVSPRAGNLRAHGTRAAAEGLCAIEIDRRGSERYVGRGRNRLAGCGQTGLVRGDARGDRAQSLAHAAAGGGGGTCG